MYFKLASKSKGDAQECDHSCKKQENERKKKKKKKTNEGRIQELKERYKYSRW